MPIEGKIFSHKGYSLIGFWVMQIPSFCRNSWKSAFRSSKSWLVHFPRGKIAFFCLENQFSFSIFFVVYFPIYCISRPEIDERNEYHSPKILFLRFLLVTYMQCFVCWLKEEDVFRPLRRSIKFCTPLYSLLFINREIIIFHLLILKLGFKKRS